MKRIFSILGLLLFLSSVSFAASDSLVWQAKKDEVNVSIQGWELSKLLEKISAQTGWQVFVEPGTGSKISAKFSGLTSDEALDHLLTSVNYSRKVTNGVTQLYVFKTSMGAATQMVQSEKLAEKSPSKSTRIPNELVVKLKRGNKRSIEELARMVNAKIIGRDDTFSLYRLQFADEASAQSAIEVLSKLDNDVAAVEANYSVEKPEFPQPPSMKSTGGGSLLDPKPPVGGGLLVGLLDTAVQPTDYDKYLAGKISVAGQADLSGDVPLHGTGMLQTMISTMADAPSRVYSADMYGASENTSTYNIVTGIAELVNKGATIINISSGTKEPSQLLEAVTAEAIAKHIVLVAAAGNDGSSSPTYPAAYPGVISVTAVNPNGSTPYYADTGSWVNTQYPGTFTQLTYGGHTWYIEGTSVSTAAISGLIASTANTAHISASAAATRVTSSYSYHN